MIAVAIATVGGRSASTSCSFSPGCRRSRATSTRPPRSTARTPWDQIRRITLPLLTPTTVLVVVLQIIASLKVFDQIYLLLEGGPNFSTRPAVQYIYEAGFTQYRVGYASALSLVFFLLIIALSALLFAGVRRAAAGERG